MRGLQIDFDIADRITLLTLIDQRKMVKDQLKKHSEGGWMHPEDVEYNVKLVKALNRVIDYFGGGNE